MFSLIHPRNINLGGDLYPWDIQARRPIRAGPLDTHLGPVPAMQCFYHIASSGPGREMEGRC